MAWNANDSRTDLSNSDLITRNKIHIQSNTDTKFGFEAIWIPAGMKS